MHALVFCQFRYYKLFHSPAVQSAKKNWSVSKKKNITRRENEAPTGRKTACAVLMVWNPTQIKGKKWIKTKSLKVTKCSNYDLHSGMPPNSHLVITSTSLLSMVYLFCPEQNWKSPVSHFPICYFQNTLTDI